MLFSEEVNVGLPPPASLQHDCHAQPHLNTMEPQLHLIIDIGQVDSEVTDLCHLSQNGHLSREPVG